MNEKQAIQRLKQGDISAMEFFVSAYQVKAVRTAYLITRDVSLAEDAVQDSFIQAFHAIDGFDPTRPFEPWFMRSVVNTAVKILQRTSRYIEMGDEMEAEILIAGTSPNGFPIESQVADHEVQEQLWEAMEKLSPRQRAAIVQRYFLDMSEKEMAEEASVANGTVKWVLNSARKRLRGLLLAKGVIYE